MRERNTKGERERDRRIEQQVLLQLIVWLIIKMLMPPLGEEAE
jgi:hypothetical protein